MVIKDEAVADFTAEFTNDSKGTSVEETNYENLEPTKAYEDDILTWILYVDGSSNAQRSGVGIILTSPEGDKIFY